MNIVCEMCDAVAPLRLYPPNLTSARNAIRCPTCGSTKNAFNREHSRLMGAVMRGDLQGPVTEAMVVEKLEKADD